MNNFIIIFLVLKIFKNNYNLLTFLNSIILKLNYLFIYLFI